MRTRIVALLALVGMLALPTTMHAQETNPLSVVNAWHEALNAYDVDAVLSCFADDGTITFVPPLEGDSVYSGKEEIRALYEGFVAATFECALTDCQVDGDTVTCMKRCTDADFQAMGVDFIEAEWVGVVREGKIQSYTYNITQESLAKFPAMPHAGGRANHTAALHVVLGSLALLAGVSLQLRQSSERRARLTIPPPFKGESPAAGGLIDTPPGADVPVVCAAG